MLRSVVVHKIVPNMLNDFLEYLESDSKSGKAKVFVLFFSYRPIGNHLLFEQIIWKEFIWTKTISEHVISCRRFSRAVDPAH